MKRLAYFFSTFTIFLIIGSLPENDTIVIFFGILFIVLSYYRFKDAGINRYWLFTILIPGIIFIIWLIGLFWRSKVKESSLEDKHDNSQKEVAGYDEHNSPQEYIGGYEYNKTQDEENTLDNNAKHSETLEKNVKRWHRMVNKKSQNTK